MRRKLLLATLLVVVLLVYGRPKRPDYSARPLTAQQTQQETPPKKAPQNEFTAETKTLAVLGVIAALTVLWLLRARTGPERPHGRKGHQ